ncbi:MAG TPA: ATP-NAD kinase family protein [Anaerovoracaceae bacterium]|nr:ATP-NAD kinase family protein [Anaerovoracaceae bacterium]
MRKVGLIVNPLAGIGGRVGLKGSDGKEIVERAFAMGAVIEAPDKAEIALSRLFLKKNQFQLLTYPGIMGEETAIKVGFGPHVLGCIKSSTTTAKDTEQAAVDMKEAGAELILFAGGDGTARNVFNAIGDSLPVIGIPAGVKIHSAVYADTPAHAGDAAALFIEGKGRIQLKESEVMDIDEEAFRKDRVSAKLYGYMMVPNVRNLMQSAKAGSTATEKESMMSIASHIVANMQEDVCYLIGPGTTMRAIMDSLNLDNTLLGVDAVLNRRLVGLDLNENKLLELLCEMDAKGIGAKAVVTVIGGQGYVFGRGNQQLSHKVLSKIGRENIIIGATEGKMIALGGKPLLVDTGDFEFDKYLSGYVKVVTSFNKYMAYRISK